MEISRPITKDRLVGFDKNGQLILCRKDGEYSSFTFITDVRRETCVICKHGWKETSTSLGDQSLWRLTETNVHASCLVRHEGLIERGHFQAALSNARLAHTKMVENPNQYWPSTIEWSAKPWYEVELIYHPAKIILGARKRVLVVEVRSQGDTELGWAKKAEEAFKDEDVTKEFDETCVMLHAWGTEKMGAYLKTIAQISGYSDDKYSDDKERPPNP